MASRRSKVSIVSEILTACMGGATKNRIVHQANLNFSTVCPYLDNLINKGLIEEVGEGMLCWIIIVYFSYIINILKVRWIYKLKTIV